MGVDAFMEKPLHIPMLLSVIKRLTSEPQHRHVSRITNRSFVTQRLASADSARPTHWKSEMATQRPMISQ